MLSQQPYDPWNEANNPPELQFDNTLWGQVKISAWPCALVKGVGKVPYDTQAHGENRHTAIDIVIHALPEMDIQNDFILKRDTLAWAKDWKTIILPSIQALGVSDARAINGKWVKVEARPTGETYQKNGEERKKTTFHFLQIFNDEAACRADYFGANGKNSEIAPQADTARTLSELGYDAPKTESAPAAPNAEREAAKQFLYFALENVTRGKSAAEAWAAVPGAIGMYPQVMKYFSMASPEVESWMTQKGFEKPEISF